MSNINKLKIDKKSYNKGHKEGRQEIMKEFKDIIEKGKPIKEPLKSEINEMMHEKQIEEGNRIKIDGGKFTIKSRVKEIKTKHQDKNEDLKIIKLGK